MAKPKKRTAAGKKSAKRGKASVKPARKTTKRAMAKKPKSKVHRVTKRVTKPAAKEKPASAESKSILAETIVETTFVTAIEQPPVGVVVIEEQAPVWATQIERGDGEIRERGFRYSGASLEELNDLIEAANLRARETRAAPSTLSEEENVSGPHVDISSDLADIGSDLGELPEQKVA